MKKTPHASSVAQRSVAVPVFASTSSTTESRSRTPIARSRSWSRHASPATSTCDVSTRTTSPSTGSTSSSSPATTSRSLQSASTTASLVPSGEPLTQPSWMSLSRSVRSSSRRQVDHHESRAVPRALARVVRDDGGDPIVPAPARLPDVQLGSSDGSDRSRRDVDRAESPSHVVRSIRRLDLRDPRGHLIGGRDGPGADRVGLLRVEPGHHDQDPGAVGRPCVLFGDALDGRERLRLADRVGGQSVQLVPARGGAVGPERERSAVRRPPGLVVVVRAVRDLPQLRAVDTDEADPAFRVALQRDPAFPAERDPAAVGRWLQVARIGDRAEPRFEGAPIERFDLAVQRRLTEVSFHGAKDRLDRLSAQRGTSPAWPERPRLSPEEGVSRVATTLGPWAPNGSSSTAPVSTT